MEATVARARAGRAAVLAAAAVAPIAWGSGYYVTETFLPPDRPLFGATVRALPFGLLLLALRPTLPRRGWWLRVAVLGVLNIAAFFSLVFVTAYRLPGGLAATLTATSPMVVAVLAWWLLRERPGAMTVAGAVLGVLGVALLVGRAGFSVDGYGVVSALAAVGLFSLGSILVKRWQPPVDLLTLTAWQLVAGGLVLLPVAVLVEGPPPAVDARAVGGFLYVGGVGTALAYVVWFRAVRAVPAAAVSLLGLLNPVAGTVVGVTLAGEAFGPVQALGTALVLVAVLAGQLRRRPEHDAASHGGAASAAGPASSSTPSARHATGRSVP